jgi:hypothetical protein
MGDIYIEIYNIYMLYNNNFISVVSVFLVGFIIAFGQASVKQLISSVHLYIISRCLFSDNTFDSAVGHTL